MTADSEKRFGELLEEVSSDPRSLEMKKYIQHGGITTYDHCRNVARISYAIACGLHLRVDEKSLVRGAFLHDYFLYDWHGHKGEGLHGFTHPLEAERNARRDFAVSDKEADIIRSHMWPLTITRIPRSREAVLVNLSDKLCSARETLFQRKRA